MKKLAFYLLMIPLFGIGMTSCSEEGNGPDMPETPQEDSAYVEDELAVLQKHLVRVDDEGNLVERIWGEVLDAATPDEVTIGVDNLAEAVEIFREFFADTTEISDDGMLATFSVQEGSAELKEANGENGLVACAAFDVPGLKYVSRINFILNSAWPENATATGVHKFGHIYEYKGFPLYEYYDKFMCIREYENGKPALLFAISPWKWTISDKVINGKNGVNLPTEEKAKEISKILQTDWESYSGKYNKACGENLLNVDEGYWYGKIGAMSYYFIRVSSGVIDYSYNLFKPYRRNLFYMESGEKM